jgi:predicted DsbA family dithiol-disulfide isomerase
MRCAPPRRLESRSLRLYVEQMDATLVDVDRDGRVRFDNEEWTTPTLQERRAILYAAQQSVEQLTEWIEILDPTISRPAT